MNRNEKIKNEFNIFLDNLISSYKSELNKKTLLKSDGNKLYFHTENCKNNYEIEITNKIKSYELIVPDKTVVINGIGYNTEDTIIHFNLKCVISERRREFEQIEFDYLFLQGE